LIVDIQMLRTQTFYIGMIHLLYGRFEAGNVHLHFWLPSSGM